MACFAGQPPGHRHANRLPPVFTHNLCTFYFIFTRLSIQLNGSEVAAPELSAGSLVFRHNNYKECCKMVLTDKKRNILVVDDEPQITRVLMTTLTSHGYAIRLAADGDEALQVMKDWPPDLLITDLSMPNMDGLQLCRSVRTTSTVPIIILSVRGEDDTKVEALDAGADDYVTKPFGINELIARIRAALRRASPAESEQTGLIEIGDFQIDTARRVVLVKSREVHLTPKEFDLLVYFARRAGRVITHRALLSALWSESGSEQLDSLRVFVGHLRKKIEGERPTRYIRTEHWIGYRFEPGD
jgi:two-component system KDP operon response regulator KdpE